MRFSNWKPFNRKIPMRFSVGLSEQPQVPSQKPLLNPSLSLDYVQKWLSFWNPDNIFQIFHSSLQGCQTDVDIKFRQTFPVSDECDEPIFSNYSVDSSLITTIRNFFPFSARLMSNNKITFIVFRDGPAFSTLINLQRTRNRLLCDTFFMQFYNFFFHRNIQRFPFTHLQCLQK